MRRGQPLLLGTALALLAAGPAAAADVEIKGLDTRAWDKPAVTIGPGDSVVWTFAGTVDFHNVKSTSGPWAHESPVGAPAPDSGFTFTAPDTYQYVCAVHSEMVGTVTVTDAAGNPPPPTPPPPPGQQPFPNDSPPLGALETGGLDRTPPALSSVRVRRQRSGARIRFRVSERAVVTVRFNRGAKIVKTKKLTASGSVRMTVRDRRALRAGRYRVELRAEDLAGNRSGLRTARLTV
jgi:plastocyanin